jgi:FMN phosphatase YigB (HAD superfamily)
MKPAIRLVVTDLDNTLYDWVTFFTTSFFRMVEAASEKLRVPRDQLLNEIREVHRRHRNSEHPFALLEIETVTKRYPNWSRGELAKEFQSVFDEFSRTRRETLKLYSGVRETLERLRLNQTPVVGHTEATVPNALYRLRALELEGFFYRLYAATPSGSGHYDKERGEALLRTSIDVKYLGPGEHKPDPRVLLDICEQSRTSPQETLYIGDSMSRDIAMAKDAGVWAAWAQYGGRYDQELWNRLTQVTHWEEEDVQRAEQDKPYTGSTTPDWVLRDSMQEIFNGFSFAVPRSEE